MPDTATFAHDPVPSAPGLTSRFDADSAAFSAYWRRAEEALARLPAKPKRDVAAAHAAAAILEAARAARVAFLDAHVATV